MQRVPPKASVAKAHYPARVGRSVEVAELERHFAMNGYSRASTVQERGEFAVRGGVIDVFPPGAEEPAVMPSAVCMAGVMNGFWPVRL